MERRFSKFNDLGFSEKLLRNPFDTDTSDFRLKEDDVRAKLQMELLQLQCDIDHRAKPPKRMPVVITVHLSCNLGRTLIMNYFHI